MSERPIEAEVVQPSMGDQLREAADERALVRATEATPGGEVVLARLFDRDPSVALRQMRDVLTMMNTLIAECGKENYISTIEGHAYPQVTWWTTIGMPLQLMPRTASMERLDAKEGMGYKGETWLALVEVVHLPTGNMVTKAYGICSADERRWSKKMGQWEPRWRDSYAICAMAQTRATGRCFRGPLAGLAVMAGLKPTPAEEMYEGINREREVKNGGPGAENVAWQDLHGGQVLEGSIATLTPRERWKSTGGGRYAKWFASAEHPGVAFKTESNPEAKEPCKRWGAGSRCRWQVAQKEDGTPDKWIGSDGTACCAVEHVRPVAKDDEAKGGAEPAADAVASPSPAAPPTDQTTAPDGEVPASKAQGPGKPDQCVVLRSPDPDGAVGSLKKASPAKGKARVAPDGPARTSAAITGAAGDSLPSSPPDAGEAASPWLPHAELLAQAERLLQDIRELGINEVAELSHWGATAEAVAATLLAKHVGRDPETNATYPLALGTDAQLAAFAADAVDVLAQARGI